MEKKEEEVPSSAVAAMKIDDKDNAAGSGAKAEGGKSKKKKKKGGGGGGGQKKEVKPERPWTDELQTDYDRILTVGEECILEADLKKLLLAKGRGVEDGGFNLYDGFEPSGRMHIAQGVFKAMNVNKCTHPGTNSKFVFWVADWFALMNDKMGGDLAKIRIVGQYLIEVWKAAGMDLSNVVFKWASEEITNHADKYWPTMLDVGRRFNVTRIKKCCQIMGRLEGSLTAAQILYPLMQCTDVFFLKADICQLGVDQRKVNMLAREYCDAAGLKFKPVILSHHMLYGLKAGQEKMSKSDPDSAVFMEDTAEDVERKINLAYCPNKEKTDETNDAAPAEEVDAGKESMHLQVDTLKNPCLDYVQHIILCPPGATFTAGGKTYSDFASVKSAFLSGEMTEQNLKKGLTDGLNELLEPVRQHFTNDENARTLLAQVRQFKKEDLKAASSDEKEERRLNLVATGKISSAGGHVVFAPLPTASPTLQMATDILARLALGGDKKKILFLSDWSAHVCSSCDADKKAISAYHTVLLSGLRSLDPTLMDDVTVVTQSDAILSDPSNYWISVINIGRHFRLDDIMGPNMKDSDAVGPVVGRLMRVADVMGLDPASIALPTAAGDVDGFGGADVDENIIGRYYDEKLIAVGMSKPDLLRGDALPIILQQREIEAHKTENDEYYLMDDPKVNGKSKMKKAFCEPGNIEFCPPIMVATTFGLGGKSQILIHRSEENGGDVTYSTKDELERDFESGALHPGDLKAAASALMVETLDKITAGIKADADVTKASKALKAFEKKMSKKKK
uniref:tyrosine--tRNA ligase n=2 Tax=Ditylum brightwellii TaxID=49249 RepID=A0A7S2EDR4_9STRA|mmetsp:Transcript_26069/g.38779  ORF Transcript_26069/g.38779 Transcript_26069/m.38779 type:complete len:792 (+) Transcript_26069:120-2495(+)